MVSPSVAIGFEWAFLILAYVTVAARVYVRIVIRRDRLLWSDGWLLVALLCAQGLLICDTLTYLKNDMNNFTDPSTSLMKIRFATNYFFDVGIYFPKFSIIALYYLIVPPTKPTMRKTLHVLTMITISACLFTFFADTFWCGPDPSVNWQLNGCSSWASMDLMRANWSLNFCTEILNLLFPFPLLSDLKLSTRREKFSLGLIFAMGFITIGVSIGRFVTMVYVDNAIPVFQDIWATTEFCTSIIIVAMTALKPLLKKITRIISSTVGGIDAGTAYRLSGNEHNMRSRRESLTEVEMGRYWRNLNPEFQAQRSISPRGGKNESEEELNGLGGRQIRKTEEISISSEVIGEGDVR